MQGGKGGVPGAPIQRNFLKASKRLEAMRIKPGLLGDDVSEKVPRGGECSAVAGGIDVQIVCQYLQIRRVRS